MSIEITAKKEIFEDKDFCESEYGDECCDFLDPAKEINSCQCRLFRDGQSPKILITDTKERRETKCDECKEAYQEALKEKEPDLEKELGEFIGRTFGEPQKPFYTLISESYPDVHYQMYWADEEGNQIHSPNLEFLHIESAEMMKTFVDDMMSLYSITAVEVEKLRKTGVDCDTDCEKYGVELVPGRNIGDCDKCPNIPPF